MALRRFLVLLIISLSISPVTLYGEEPNRIGGVFRETLYAAENLPSGRIRIEPWAFINLGFGFSGISIFPAVDTVLWLTAGGDLDSAGYYVKPDGSLYTGADPDINPESDLFYYYLRPQFSLGITQGLVPDMTRKGDLLEWYFFIRFQKDSYFFNDGTREDHLLTRSNLPEREGIALIYFISGLNLNTVKRSSNSRVLRGIQVDLCGSAAPGTRLNVVNGQTYSYGGVHLDIRGFLPYVEIVSDRGLNLFSMYQGWWLRGDYVFGPYIPLQVLQNFSGRMWKEGLGGAVRGLDTNRYPAPLKIIASTDLRMNLPAVGVSSFFPGAVLFFDAGYFRFFNEIVNGDEAGIVLSTGGGFFIDLFGIGEIAACAAFLINDTNVDGTRFTPFDVSINLHF